METQNENPSSQANVSHTSRNTIYRDDIEYDLAEPQILPTPTFWPFVMAVGLTFLLWWIVASWIVGVVGFCLFVVGLYGWIQELRKEENQET